MAFQQAESPYINKKKKYKIHLRRRNKPIPTASCKKPSQEMVRQELTFF